MMNKRKKILALLLTIFMISGGISLHAFALTGGILTITYGNGDPVVKPRYGETLKADISQLNGIDDVANIEYKWRRHTGTGVGSTSSDIVGAASQTYTLTEEDLDKYIEVRVSEDNFSTSVNKILANVVEKIVTAKPNAPIGDANRVTTYTTINIDTTNGQAYAIRLTSDTTSPLDFNVTGNGSSHQFSGLTRDTSYNIYTKVAETATHSASECSEPLVRITGLQGILGMTYLNGSPLVAPKFGETLKVDLSGITNPSGTYTYKWMVSGLEVASGESCNIVEAYIGKSLTLVLKTSDFENTKAAISPTLGKADTMPPLPATLGSVTPTTIAVSTVAGQNYEIFTGGETPQTAMSTDIKTGDGNTIEFTSLEPNTAYDVYTMINSTSTHKASGYSEKVTTTTGAATDLRGSITIDHDGSPQYGETLTANITGITNGNYGGLTYQWLRDDSSIGTNTAGYTIDQAADIGESIKVKVTSDALTGYLESASVTPQLGDRTLAPPVIVDQTNSSITIETVADQKYAIRLSSSSDALDYGVEGTGNPYTFTGLLEETEYKLYTKSLVSTCYKASESLPRTAYIYGPLTPVKNIISLVATDTTSNVPQRGVSFYANNRQHKIMVIMPIGTPLNSIRIDYQVEDGVTVTGVASGQVVDFSTSLSKITLTKGLDTQEWSIETIADFMAPHVMTKADVTAYGGTNGNLKMDTWYAGYVPYEYSIDSGTTWQSNDTFTNLVSGTYTMQVRKRYDTSGSKIQFAPTIITQPAQPNNSGSSGNSSSSSKAKEEKNIPKQPVPVAPITTTDKEGQTKVSAEMKVKIVGQTQSVDIDKSTGKNLIEAAKKAEETGEEAVIEINLNTKKDTENIEIALERTTFKGIAEDTTSSLKIKHNMVDLRFDIASIDAINKASTAGGVQVSARKVDVASLPKAAKEMLADQQLPVFDFTVTSGGKKVTDFAGGQVTIAIPYKASTEQDVNAIVVYFLSDEGLLEPVEGHYNAQLGTVIFSTNHFSKYLVAYNLKKFDDVCEADWFCDAVTYIAAREITDGKSATAFAPNDTITRAEFITLMVRYFKFESDQKDSYTDVDPNQWYAKPVNIAKSKGILPSIYGDTLEPSQPIAREEMMYILYKSLAKVGRLKDKTISKENLESYKDFQQIAAYAKAGITYLIAQDIVNGHDDGTIAPKSNSSRAEVAQLIFNLVEK